MTDAVSPITDADAVEDSWIDTDGTKDDWEADSEDEVEREKPGEILVLCVISLFRNFSLLSADLTTLR